MPNPGRPKVIDDKVRELLVGLVTLGCSRKQAARHMGISPSTLFLTLSKDEAFAEQMRLAEMQQNVNPLRKIIQHSEKSWRAAAWLVEHKGRLKPHLVSKGDCMALLRTVLGQLVQEADAQQRQRIADQLKRIDLLLTGRSETTPRGRRLVKELKAEVANCRTDFAPNGPTTPKTPPTIGENPAFEQGGGI